VAFRFSVYTRKTTDPRTAAMRILLWRYGTGCLPGRITDIGKAWHVPIDVYMPVRIWNEESSQQKLVTYQLSDVGSLELAKRNLRLMNATHLGAFRKNIRLRRAEYKRSVEYDLVKAAKHRWGFGRRSLQHMEPTFRTVTNLLREIHPTKDELVGLGYMDQVQLLIDMGYAQFTSQDLLDATPKLLELQRSDVCKNDIESTAKVSVGLMISQFYDHLTEDLRLNSFVPYIRMGTAYYSDSIDYGELIPLKRDKLKENLVEFYAGAPRVRFGLDVTINETIATGIIHKEGELIRGDKMIFETLLEVRKSLPVTEDVLSRETRYA